MDNDATSHEISEIKGVTPQKKLNQEAEIRSTQTPEIQKNDEAKIEIDDEETQGTNPLKEIYTRIQGNHPFIFFAGNAIVIFISISLIVGIFTEEEALTQPKETSQQITQEEITKEEKEVIAKEITNEKGLQEEAKELQLTFAKEAITTSLKLNQEEAKYDLFNHQINILTKGITSDSFLMPEITLLTRSEQARNIPLMNNLRQISSIIVREKYIHDYMTMLTSLNDEMENSLHNIATNNKIIKEEYRQLQKENRAIQKQINTIESIENEDELQSIIQRAKDTKHNEDSVELKMKLNEKIERKLEKSKELLVARLEGVNLNQDALVYTVTVNAIKNMNLDIIQGKIPMNSITTARELQRKKEIASKPMPGVKNSFANIASKSGSNIGSTKNIAQAITGNNMASQVMQMKSMSTGSAQKTNTFGGTFQQLFTGVKYLN